MRRRIGKAEIIFGDGVEAHFDLDFLYLKSVSPSFDRLSKLLFKTEKTVSTLFL
jgi:hypothetical protein